MRLASYVRGIGIGMAVTALILHFSDSRAAGTMSDEEVMARARELGMTQERTTLVDPSANVSADPVALANVGEDGAPGLTDILTVGDPTHAATEAAAEATATATPAAEATATPKPTRSPHL